MENEIKGIKIRMEIENYDSDIEELFIRYLISEGSLFARCIGILSSENFKDAKNKKVVEFLIDYAESYSKLPTLEQIEVATKKKLTYANDAEDHSDWFLQEFERFSRHRQLEKAILASVDLLEQQRYGEVELKIKQAVQIGLVKDLGTDYFRDPVARLDAIRNNKGNMSTGWKTIDAKTNGINRGELSIFAGLPGQGKSLFLQNMAVNWAFMGLNVVYITLELSENLCAMRLDAMITGTETREVIRDIETTAIKVNNFKKTYKGNIQLKQLRNGCTSNDIRAFIKEYEIETKNKVDAVLIDYLDLMMPGGVKVSVSDQFVKDKYVSEELRNLAIDLNVLMATASQLNRSGYEEVDFNGQNIAGGLSKINTADNVMAIYSSVAMKESGRYQIQFIKTRSSAGVGSKVDLKYNPRSLRIEDLDESEQDSAPIKTASTVLEALSRNKTAKQEETPTDIKGKITDVRSLIKKIQK